MWKTVLATLAVTILKKAAAFIWETLWKIVGEAMIEVEKKWQESGSGTIRKEWVMNQAMGYITTHIKLNFLTGWIVQTFVSNVVDQVIDQLNIEFTDHKWIERVTELRTYIEKFLPIF